MLAYVLALAVGLGSVGLYMAAFFFPEIHRKNDFIWSGVGLFYALVLWIFAQRITGGFLLGHVASVALLGWFGWQTLSLRRQLTPTTQQTQIPSTETVKTNIQEQVSKLSLPQRLSQLQKGIGSTFSGAKDRVQQTVSQKTSEKPKTAETPPAPAGKAAVEIVDERTPVPEQQVVASPAITDIEAKTPPQEQLADVTASAPTEAKTDSVPQVIPPHPPSPELVEAAHEHTETEKTLPPVEEIAPDAALAPPAEGHPGEIPPNPPGQSS
ncbi:Ycf66 family protein [Mastigocladopsis repens]|uniref:Ycf66 family protein n=1 Tax=Mastigocladopsis repens TaxID=221287 RepID=UPI0002F3CD55|nr:Ycf66 family protein [Mastigocladopsis repens]